MALLLDPFETGLEPFADHNARRMMGKHEAHLLATDIHETPSAFVLDVEMPGFTKDEVSAEVKDGVLTVSCQKKVDEEAENQKGRLIRQERFSGSAQRSFVINEHVHEDQCKATFANGVLTVMVPKESQQDRAQRRFIKID